VFLSNGSVTSLSGVTDLLNDVAEYSKPRSRNVVDLGSGISIEKMRYSPVLVAFIENCSSAVQSTVKSTLSSLEKDLRSAPDSFPLTSRSNILISYIEKSGELANLLRKLAQVPAISTENKSSVQPQFAILDLATENIAANDITTRLDVQAPPAVGSDPSSFPSQTLQHMLKEFVNKYQSYELETFPLRPFAADSTNDEDADSSASEEEDDDTM
jgi:hypothetical protein